MPKRMFTTNPPAHREGIPLRCVWQLVIEQEEYNWDGGLPAFNLVRRLHGHYETLNAAIEAGQHINEGVKILAITQTLYQDGDYLAPVTLKKEPKPYQELNKAPKVAGRSAIWAKEALVNAGMRALRGRRR